MSFFLQSADWIDIVGVVFDQGMSFVWAMEGTESHIITSTSDGTHLGFAPAGSCLGGLAPAFVHAQQHTPKCPGVDTFPCGHLGPERHRDTAFQSFAR